MPVIYYLILLPLGVTFFLTPSFIKCQEGKNFTTTNFQGKDVVTGGGLVLLAALFVIYPVIYFAENEKSGIWLLYLLFLLGIAFLGLVDDIWGDKNVKGLKGHFKKLWKREGVTTGVYKAAGGLFLGITFSMLLGGKWPDCFFQGVFLALASNFLNLTDTRPGRSVKLFFFCTLILVFFFKKYFMFLVPVWSSLFIYLPWELDKRIMLGNTGANLLGGVLGFYIVLHTSRLFLIFLVIILVLFHWFCDNYSLSMILDRRKTNIYAQPGRRSSDD